MSSIETYSCRIYWPSLILPQFESIYLFRSRTDPLINWWIVTQHLLGQIHRLPPIFRLKIWQLLDLQRIDHCSLAMLELKIHHLLQECTSSIPQAIKQLQVPKQFCFLDLCLDPIFLTWELFGKCSLRHYYHSCWTEAIYLLFCYSYFL
jgi:hypothetical protein